MEKKINWLEILLWAIMVVLFIMILTRIFGNSATDIQIYLAFFSSLVLVAGYMISSNNKIMSHIVKLNREVGEIKAEVNSFRKDKEEVEKDQK